jgi:hypothetical protein
MLAFGLGLVLREWLALCVPPPLNDFRRLGSEMRTMVDGRKLPAWIRLFGLGWQLLLTAQHKSLTMLSTGAASQPRNAMQRDIFPEWW